MQGKDLVNQKNLQIWINYKVEETTSFASVLSNNTTLPPRSPVARWSPVLSNSIAEMTSTAKTETENKSWDSKEVSKFSKQFYHSKYFPTIWESDATAERISIIITCHQIHYVIFDPTVLLFSRKGSSTRKNLTVNYQQLSSGNMNCPKLLVKLWYTPKNKLVLLRGIHAQYWEASLCLFLFTWKLSYQYKYPKL